MKQLRIGTTASSLLRLFLTKQENAYHRQDKSEWHPCFKTVIRLALLEYDHQCQMPNTYDRPGYTEDDPNYLSGFHRHRDYPSRSIQLSSISFWRVWLPVSEHAAARSSASERSAIPPHVSATPQFQDQHRPHVALLRLVRHHQKLNT